MEKLYSLFAVLLISYNQIVYLLSADNSNLIRNFHMLIFFLLLHMVSFNFLPIQALTLSKYTTLYRRDVTVTLYIFTNRKCVITCIIILVSSNFHKVLPIQKLVLSAKRIIYHSVSQLVGGSGVLRTTKRPRNV